MSRAGINCLKQARGKLIVELADEYGATEMARNRRPEEIDESAQVWRRIVREINAEFPELPALSIDKAKNAYRHYKRENRLSLEPASKRKTLKKSTIHRSGQNVRHTNPHVSEWVESVISAEPDVDHIEETTHSFDFLHMPENTPSPFSPVPSSSICDRISHEVAEMFNQGHITNTQLLQLIGNLQSLLQQNHSQSLSMPLPISNPVQEFFPQFSLNANEEFRGQIHSLYLPDTNYNEFSDDEHNNAGFNLFEQIARADAIDEREFGPLDTICHL